MDITTIAQLASAVGTVGLTVLFGLQLRVFYRLGLSQPRHPPRDAREPHRARTPRTASAAPMTMGRAAGPTAAFENEPSGMVNAAAR